MTFTPYKNYMQAQSKARELGIDSTGKNLNDLNDEIENVLTASGTPQEGAKDETAAQETVEQSEESNSENTEESPKETVETPIQQEETEEKSAEEIFNETTQIEETPVAPIVKKETIEFVGVKNTVYEAASNIKCDDTFFEKGAKFPYDKVTKQLLESGSVIAIGGIVSAE